MMQETEEEEEWGLKDPFTLLTFEGLIMNHSFIGKVNNSIQSLKADYNR